MIDIIRLEENIKSLLEGNIIHNVIEEELSIRGRRVENRVIKEFVRSLIYLDKYLKEGEIEEEKIGYVKRYLSLVVDKKGYKVEVSPLKELFKEIEIYVLSESSLRIYNNRFIYNLVFSEIIKYFFKGSKIKIKMIDGEFFKSKTASFRIKPITNKPD